MDKEEGSGSGSAINNNNNNCGGGVMKKPKTKSSRRRRRLNMTRKEKVKLLEEIREKGIITRYPRFIPPQRPLSIPPNLTHEQEAEFVFGLFKGPGITISHDVYHPAKAPGQLSLPEIDESARVALYSCDIPERKKKRGVSIGKQKVKVASFSKKPMTNA